MTRLKRVSNSTSTAIVPIADILNCGSRHENNECNTNYLISVLGSNHVSLWELVLI